MTLCRCIVEEKSSFCKALVLTTFEVDSRQRSFDELVLEISEKTPTNCLKKHTTCYGSVPSRHVHHQTLEFTSFTAHFG